VPVQILIDTPAAELPCYPSLALKPHNDRIDSRNVAMPWFLTPVGAGFLIHVACIRSEYQAMRDDGFSHLTLSSTDCASSG
jgi:hypothetical protein